MSDLETSPNTCRQDCRPSPHTGLPSSSPEGKNNRNTVNPVCLCVCTVYICYFCLTLLWSNTLITYCICLNIHLWNSSPSLQFTKETFQTTVYALFLYWIIYSTPLFFPKSVYRFSNCLNKYLVSSKHNAAIPSQA